MEDQLTDMIAADLGIKDLPIEEQRSLISQFGEVALKAATLAVVEKLSDEKRDMFMTLSEQGDPTALKTFLDQEVPGHEGIVKEAVAEEVKRFKAFQAV